MSGDKLKRVKSVKYWLNKAEDSYEKDKNMSAEINLIMAQAEMQRLKEKHAIPLIRTWGIRFSALFVALFLYGGVNFVLDSSKQVNRNSYQSSDITASQHWRQQKNYPLLPHMFINYRNGACVG